MSSAETYDILVIGSGESCKYLAWTMASEGHRTAVVERKLIGGSCPNIACLPSKNIIQSAKVRSFTRRAAEEMRERLGVLCGQRGDEITVTTFHGLGGCCIFGFA